MLGDSSRLSLTTWGLSMNAAFGAESNGGGGKPELEVVHSGAGPWAFVAVQPAGSWGGVTPSKAWLNVVTGFTQAAAPASRTSALAVDAATPPAGGQQRRSDRRPPHALAGEAQARTGRPAIGSRVVHHGRASGRKRRGLASEAPQLAAGRGAAGGVRRARHGCLLRPRVRRDVVVPGPTNHTGCIAPARDVEMAADDTGGGTGHRVRFRQAWGEIVRAGVVLPRRRLRTKRIGVAVAADQVDLSRRAVVAGRHGSARRRHVRRGAPRACAEVKHPGGIGDRARARILAAEDVDLVGGRVEDGRRHGHGGGHRRQQGFPPLVDRVVPVEGVQRRVRACRAAAGRVRVRAVGDGRRAVQVLRHG